MKRYLTIILLVSVLSLQAQYNYKYFRKDTFIETFPNIWQNSFRLEIIDSTNWYSNISQFVQLWEQYEMKCYNDSSASIVHRIVDYDRSCHMTLMWPPESNYCNNPNHYNDMVYTHPATTLTGFKEYLKSKLE